MDAQDLDNSYLFHSNGETVGTFYWEYSLIDAVSEKC